MFRKALLILPVVLATSCTSNQPLDTPDTGVVVPPPPGPDGGTINPGDDGGMMMVLEFPPSSKSNVRFKRTERLKNDFANALGLTPAALCKELGQYSCTDFVHTIALGGVEPYNLGIREGLEHTTITTPLAVERVALAGCEQRVTADLADENAALIYKGLGIDANGGIADLDATGVTESIDRLYKRALLRAPRDTEIEHLKQMYRDFEGVQEPQPARDWAILSCFSVLTTMEALFY